MVADLGAAVRSGLIRAGGGVIICTASSQAEHTRPGHAAYSASNAPCRASSGRPRSTTAPRESACSRSTPARPTPRLLRPPGIPDDLWAQFKQAWGPLNVHGLHRMAEAKEMATAVVALASPDFSYLSGTSVLVDGAMNAGRPMTMPPGFPIPQ